MIRSVPSSTVDGKGAYENGTCEERFKKKDEQL